MIKIKRIITVVLLVILLISSMQNIAQAVSYKQDVNIYQLGKCDYTLQYKRPDGVWSYITCTYVVYQENGKTYPAYCLNKDLDGVGEINNYDVNLEKLIDDVRLWRVVINGFPYKSAAELGVYNDYDAFLATKQAIYSILYDWDVETRFRGGNERGVKVHEALKKMVYEGRYGTYTPQSANVKVDKTGELKDEGDYYSQEYTVSSLVEMSRYTITNVINSPSRSYIADMNNNSKTTFNAGENFKLRIPKDAITNDINIKINVQSKCKTYPVFFGKTYLEGTQNYLVTTDPFGDEVGQGTLDIKTNTGKIVVNKIDSQTKEPIEDVIFGLYKKDGTEITRATTNKNGIATFTNLYQDNYVLKEISANEKYILNKMEFDVNVTYNKTTTVNIENEHKKGNLKVYKVDKDNNKIALGGVKFELYSEEFEKVIGTYTTNENGEIYIENLRIGDYKLHEVLTNKWYNLTNDTNVKVEWNETINSTIENELKKSQAKVIKVDKDNNDIKLEGVKFEVLDENQKVLETIVTDKNGEALTSKYPIRDFKKLYIRETETLKNYVLDDKIIEITLEENKIKTVELQNEKKKGQIKVVKIDKDNNELKLEGVIFEVYDENVNLVDTLITNKKGEAVSKKLQIDQEYTVKEIKTLKTYVLSKEPQKVILKQDQITTLTFENEKKKGQIEIIKIDEENKEVKLEGVTFEILDQDKNIVDTVITDKEGKALTKRLPIDGEFIVREKETKKEYILLDEIVKVVLEENEIKSITFENTKKKGSIKILKVSKGDNLILNIPDGTPLAGAKFTIVDGKGNIIGIYETDENGTVQIDDIPYGEYTIYESEVPEGYLMDAEPQTIFISEDGEIIETIFKDSPIEPELPKTGIDININAAIIFVVLISLASIIAVIKKYKKMEE